MLRRAGQAAPGRSQDCLACCRTWFPHRPPSDSAVESTRLLPMDLAGDRGSFFHSTALHPAESCRSLFASLSRSVDAQPQPTTTSECPCGIKYASDARCSGVNRAWMRPSVRTTCACSRSDALLRCSAAVLAAASSKVAPTTASANEACARRSSTSACALGLELVEDAPARPPALRSAGACRPESQRPTDAETNRRRRSRHNYPSPPRPHPPRMSRRTSPGSRLRWFGKCSRRCVLPDKNDFPGTWVFLCRALAPSGFRPDPMERAWCKRARTSDGATCLTRIRSKR